MQWQTAPARWRVLFGKVAEKYRAGGRMQTEYADMRKGLNSLVPFVQQNFGIDPYSSSLFLFCGKRCDRLKALLWEPDGFVLLYKRLDNGRYQWPRNAQEVKPLTWEQFTWLMQGLNIEQPRAIRPGGPKKLV
jgi:transposase